MSNRPAQWTDLDGPFRGHFDVPGFGFAFFGGEAWQFTSAFRALLTDGSAEDVQRFIHPRRLLQAWPAIAPRLPSTARFEWETAFPQLRRQLVYAVSVAAIRDNPAAASFFAGEMTARVVLVAEKGEPYERSPGVSVLSEMTCWGRNVTERYLQEAQGAKDLPPHIVWFGWE